MCGYLKLIKIKENLKFGSSVSLATFQELKGYMWLATIILDIPEHVHSCRRFCTRCIVNEGITLKLS